MKEQKMAGADAAAIIVKLGLAPHPKEGGWFRETYRAGDGLAAAALPARYGAARSASTAIYYLLDPVSVSALHLLASDEVFHFYAGDPVEQLRLYPAGTRADGAAGAGEIVTLGADLFAGQVPQSVVPRGVWQGARLKPGGRYALLGCTVAPGFDYADYVAGDRAALQAAFPEHAAFIAALTP